MRFLSVVLAFIISSSLMAANAKTLTLPVKGMVCSSCESKITESLLKLPGVESVKADHTAGTAIITLAPQSKTTEKEIKAAITKAGFKVEG